MASLEDMYEDIDSFYHKKVAEVQMEFVEKKLQMEKDIAEIRAETFGYGINETQPEKDFRLEIFRRDTKISMLRQLRELSRKKALQFFEERGLD